jgi:hypothetical protein
VHVTVLNQRDERLHYQRRDGGSNVGSDQGAAKRVHVKVDERVVVVQRTRQCGGGGGGAIALNRQGLLVQLDKGAIQVGAAWPLSFGILSHHLFGKASGVKRSVTAPPQGGQHGLARGRHNATDHGHHRARPWRYLCDMTLGTCTVLASSFVLSVVTVGHHRRRPWQHLFDDNTRVERWRWCQGPYQRLWFHRQARSARSERRQDGRG